MSRRACPVHRKPLVTHGDECRACEGEGTVIRDSQLWEARCNECQGSGLEYYCPDCDQEEAEEDERREVGERRTLA